MLFVIRSMLLGLLALLAGCAAEVVRHPEVLSAASATPVSQYVVRDEVYVRFDSGYARTISAGMRFAEIGSVKQGKVLKPINAVFTIEGTHNHEAYPVVEDTRIVGFYLPVEKAFAPLSNPVLLILEKREIQK